MSEKQKKYIVIVEDDPDILESLQIVLQMREFEIDTMKDGRNLMSHLEKKKPDLLLMDVMMPAPDGFELCRQVKANEKTKSIPVLLISARTQADAVETGFKMGADRYLFKPFMPDELERVIDQLLKGKQK